MTEFIREYKLEYSSILQNTIYYLIYSTKNILINVSADNMQPSNKINEKELQFGEAYYLKNQFTHFFLRQIIYSTQDRTAVAAVALGDI